MEFSGANRRLTALLNDPRDLPMLHLMIGCAALATVGISLFFANQGFWLLALAYGCVWGFGFLDRFILLLHCTSHRALFRPEHDWMKRIIPWGLAPFFGQTPESYFAHHIGMHHIENNLRGDLSSTMRYRRDSFRAWLHYVGSFLLTGLPRLAAYHWRRGSRHLFWRLVAGEAVFWSLAAVLAYVNWRATLVVFVGPVILVRLLMMAGNWGQHAFIDAANPAETFRSSITCINTRYNRRCFNDGYHTVHHHRPRLHYTEMPGEFERRRDEYGRQDAIVFDGLDFFQVWGLLMLGRHRTLARRFVRLPGAPERTDDEVLVMLESRLAPAGAPHHS